MVFALSGMGLRWSEVVLGSKKLKSSICLESLHNFFYVGEKGGLQGKTGLQIVVEKFPAPLGIFIDLVFLGQDRDFALQLLTPSAIIMYFFPKKTCRD